MPKFVNIEDLRRAAKWNMPKPMFDYVDGAANAEWTARENRAGFERIIFDPRVLVDVSVRDSRRRCSARSSGRQSSSRRPA